MSAYNNYYFNTFFWKYLQRIFNTNKHNNLIYKILLLTGPIFWGYVEGTTHESLSDLW